MMSYLHDGELILTNKIVYRFYTPERGDVITFKAPTDPKKNFIKRIIGLPGEKLEVTQNRVKVYNKQYPEGFFVNEPYLDSFQLTQPGIYFQEGNAVTIPPNEYMVMGDNRLNSFDSRSWGTLKKDAIIGKAWFVYWPFDRLGFNPSVKADK
jgi:signal peptidase I